MTEDDASLRPDVIFGIKRSRELHDCDDYDLEANDAGFYCPECGWRSPTLPAESLNWGSEEMESTCPECGEPGVKSTLTDHISEIQAIDDREYVADDDFVPYSYFREHFDGPTARLDDALNYLISRDDAYVVFDGGRPQININRD